MTATSDVPDVFFGVYDPWTEEDRRRFAAKQPRPNALIVERRVRDVGFLDELSGIRRLHIRTRLKSLAPILRCEHLEYLSFQDGHSTEPIDASQLPRLSFLDVNCTAGIESIAHHPRLEVLRGSVRGHRSLDWLAAVSHLREVTLSGRSQKVDASVFAGLGQLRILELDDSLLIEPDLSWIGDFTEPRLEELSLTIARGRTVDLAPLAKLPELCCLYLCGDTRFVNVETVLALPRLEWLEIYGDLDPSAQRALDIRRRELALAENRASPE